MSAKENRKIPAESGLVREVKELGQNIFIAGSVVLGSSVAVEYLAPDAPAEIGVVVGGGAMFLGGVYFATAKISGSKRN